MAASALRSAIVFLLLSLALSAPTRKPGLSDADLFDIFDDDDNDPKPTTKSQTTTTAATTTTNKPPPPKAMDDLDLLDFGDPGKKSDTPTKPKDNDVPSRSGGGGEFSDDDLFGGGDPSNKPVIPAKPKTDHNFDGTNSGSISDDDLLDITGGKRPAGGGGSGGSGGSGARGGNIPSPTTGPDADAAVPGTVAGILGALAAAILAGGSSFVAYQKKKLCFKAPDDGEGQPDGQRGEDPQLFSALLSQASRFFSGGGTQQQQQQQQQQQPGSPLHDGYVDEEKV
ncbi:CD99 antigen isoform X2 [Lampetra fluviatilis]